MLFSTCFLYLTTWIYIYQYKQSRSFFLMAACCSIACTYHDKKICFWTNKEHFGFLQCLLFTGKVTVEQFWCMSCAHLPDCFFEISSWRWTVGFEALYIYDFDTADFFLKNCFNFSIAKCSNWPVMDPPLREKSKPRLSFPTFVCFFFCIRNNYVSFQADIILFQSQLCHELSYMILDKVLNLVRPWFSHL